MTRAMGRLSRLRYPLRLWLATLLLVVSCAPHGMSEPNDLDPPAATSGYLGGQFLVAAPGMPDPRFAESVIYMISHDSNGAMGLVINRRYGRGPLKSLLAGFGVTGAEVDDVVALYYGGPVEQARGFILHSIDYQGASTQLVGDDIAVSTGRDVLEAVAGGKGPSRRVFVLGYAGWGPGQLENELAHNDWMTAPADPEVVFSEDIDRLWDRVMENAGIEL